MKTKTFILSAAVFFGALAFTGCESKQTKMSKAKMEVMEADYAAILERMLNRGQYNAIEYISGIERLIELGATKASNASLKLLLGQYCGTYGSDYSADFSAVYGFSPSDEHALFAFKNILVVDEESRILCKEFLKNYGLINNFKDDLLVSREKHNEDSEKMKDIETVLAEKLKSFSKDELREIGESSTVDIVLKKTWELFVPKANIAEQIDALKTLRSAPINFNRAMLAMPITRATIKTFCEELLNSSNAVVIVYQRNDMPDIIKIIPLELKRKMLDSDNWSNRKAAEKFIELVKEASIRKDISYNSNSNPTGKEIDKMP